MRAAYIVRDMANRNVIIGAVVVLTFVVVLAFVLVPRVLHSSSETLVADSDATNAYQTCIPNYAGSGFKCTPNSNNWPAGHVCEFGPNCSGGACGRLTATSGAALACCPSGKTDLYAGYEYCTGMPPGSACWSDAMCASGQCSGNAGGLRRGTCS